MTNAQAELVVTQADREAAAAFFHAWYKTSESSRSYNFTKACEDDRNPAVQAFARHRAAEIERMAGEVERLRAILSFDCSLPGVEGAAIKWANRISGMKGQKPYHPDPVGVLELCEDIARQALSPSVGEDHPPITTNGRRG